MIPGEWDRPLDTSQRIGEKADRDLRAEIVRVGIARPGSESPYWVRVSTVVSVLLIFMWLMMWATSYTRTVD